MNESKIVYKKVSLRSPILIVGLPGIGNVGNLAAQYLVQKLNAKEFATLYSPHFPYIVIATPDGGFRLVSNRFYYYKNKKLSHDLVILIGDYQPASSEGQYEVNDKIVRFFKSLGGKEVYTLGGYSTEDRYVPNPRVFGVTKSKAMHEKLEKAGVVFNIAPSLSIVGAAGMVLAFADEQHMQVACIMGETGMLEVDANSAKSVLEVLSKLLNIDIDLKDMNNLQKETEKFIKELEQASKSAQHEEFPNYIK
ncbi:MAG: proteasome assembly chaperone family protein [Candidatus Micrarchaeia archaeon]